MNKKFPLSNEQSLASSGWVAKPSPEIKQNPKTQRRWKKITQPFASKSLNVNNHRVAKPWKILSITNFHWTFIKYKSVMLFAKNILSWMQNIRIESFFVVVSDELSWQNFIYFVTVKKVTQLLAFTAESITVQQDCCWDAHFGPWSLFHKTLSGRRGAAGSFLKILTGTKSSVNKASFWAHNKLP